MGYILLSGTYYNLDGFRRGTSNLDEVRDWVIIVVVLLVILFVAFRILLKHVTKAQDNLPEKHFEQAKVIQRNAITSAGTTSQRVDYIVEDIQTGERATVSAFPDQTHYHTFTVGDIGDITFKDATGTKYLSKIISFQVKSRN